MITLYTFGPYFGLPDGSPFVTKAMMLLKLAGLPYREDRGGYGKAPKGKLPFIDDDGTIVADSTFIRWHLESRHAIQFDAGLTEAQRAQAWAVERMCEDHLYWAIIEMRWLRDENFAKGPAKFFDAVPAPIRPIVKPLMRRRVAASVKAHGMGRHTRHDIERLAIRDIEALSAILGESPYLMGNTHCGADATTFAFIAGALCPHFDSPIRTAAEACANLVAYRDRMMAAYFPDLVTK